MKALLASAVVTLVSVFAMAQGEVQINWPSVNGLSVNNACATADTFRSLAKVTTCTATKDVRYAVSNQGEVGMVKRELAAGEALSSGEYLQVEKTCAAYGSRSLVVSRNTSTRECAYYTPAGQASEPCSKFITKTAKVGTTFSVEKIVRYGEADQQTFFNYTVPACN